MTQPKQIRKFKLDYRNKAGMRRRMALTDERWAAQSGEVKTHQATPEERERYGIKA